jgi:hypothetical protein
VARIRTVKPEWRSDEKMKAASDEARVLSIALITLADDYGNGEAGDLVIAGAVWSSLLPREALAKSSRAIRELFVMGYVEVYKVSNQSYFHITNWTSHQRVDKPGRPQVPGPERADSHSQDSDITPANSQELLPGDSRLSSEVLAPDLGPRIGTIGPRNSTHSPASPVSLSDLEAQYQRYPKKQGKKKGMLSVRKAIQTTDQLSALTQCVDKMQAWLAPGVDRKYCPMWSTFANGRLWEDDEPPLPAVAEHKPVPSQGVVFESTGKELADVPF